jgi:hypothetical protein
MATGVEPPALTATEAGLALVTVQFAGTLVSSTLWLPLDRLVNSTLPFASTDRLEAPFRTAV